jgi:uncharacterized coiled-coil protein SlyX
MLRSERLFRVYNEKGDNYLRRRGKRGEGMIQERRTLNLQAIDWESRDLLAEITALNDVITRSECDCTFDDNGEVLSWCCSHRAWKERAEKAEARWTELSTILACTSVSGDAELDQVRFLQERVKELEEELKCEQSSISKTYSAPEKVDGMVK